MFGRVDHDRVDPKPGRSSTSQPRPRSVIARAVGSV
jgi:hypothetical protein